MNDNLIIEVSKKDLIKLYKLTPLFNQTDIENIIGHLGKEIKWHRIRPCSEVILNGTDFHKKYPYIEFNEPVHIVLLDIKNELSQKGEYYSNKDCFNNFMVCQNFKIALFPMSRMKEIIKQVISY